ncbi:MAG: ferritin family protein [Phycisphaerae bacterium]|nr:ferritin family protein [Phycisphaerae bacterium]
MEHKKPHIEILKLAISREVESINLYLAMAEFFVKQEISSVFIDIANEEMKHKNDLELEVMKLGHTIEIERDFASVSMSDPELAEKLMPDGMDYKNLLSMAINREEESFRFYVDSMESIKDHQSREIVYALAQEEARHKHRFQFEYDLLSKKET